ncbi:MAG: flavin reductase family protein [Bacteroidales bacterium]|nr:flavin reductase family protein [Bacteroidales bacterium]
MAKNGKRVMRAGNMLNPTPVVMVSCGSTIDEYNIITVAWTGTLCSDPPLCYISVRPSRHSHQLIKKSGEFVINLVNEELAAVADWCGVQSGSAHHKFLDTGLTPVRGEHVSCPMIAEAPVNIECKVKEIIPLGTHDMFLAEVLAVHAQASLFNHKTDALELQRANLLAYSHGHYYKLGKILGKFGFSVEKKSSK